MEERIVHSVDHFYCRNNITKASRYRNHSSPFWPPNGKYLLICLDLTDVRQTPILITHDRFGHHLDALLPDRSEESVSSVLKQARSKTDVLLRTDGDPALIAFATKEAIECEPIIASRGEHVHENVLRIQTVNSYVNRFKKWMARFNDVATKYLPNYPNWRLTLEKRGVYITPEHCLVAAIGSNHTHREQSYSGK